MLRKIGVAFAGFLVAIVLVAAGLAYWSHREDQHRLREGNQLVQRIEQFHLEKKRLPNGLEELGVKEDALFYDRRGDGAYVVWFGKALGDSVTFDSRVGVWRTTN